MKAGTTALHRLLDSHPDLAMSSPKELNFFFGADRPEEPQPDWSPRGNWWRGTDWYRRHFPDDGRLGGEISPGYTSPDHPRVAERLGRTIPDVRLVYLVREPLERAISQYRHHVRDGAEHRPLDEALLDPDSQYVARSRYRERLAPFLAHVASEQVLVLAQEDLAAHTQEAVDRVHDHVGVPRHRDPDVARTWHAAPDDRPACPPDVAKRFRERVVDDVEALRAHVSWTRAGWLA